MKSTAQTGRRGISFSHNTMDERRKTWDVRRNVYRLSSIVYRLTLRLSKFFMSSVAVGGSFRAFAAAPGDGFSFGDDLDVREHARCPVRAVAKRLLTGFAAGAPRVPSRFHLKDKGFIRCVREFLFCHMWVHFKGKNEKRQHL